MLAVLRIRAVPRGPFTPIRRAYRDVLGTARVCYQLGVAIRGRMVGGRNTCATSASCGNRGGIAGPVANAAYPPPRATRGTRAVRALHRTARAVWHHKSHTRAASAAVIVMVAGSRYTCCVQAYDVPVVATAYAPHWDVLEHGTALNQGCIHLVWVGPLACPTRSGRKAGETHAAATPLAPLAQGAGGGGPGITYGEATVPA